MFNDEKMVIAIMGPTASGKTDLALLMADVFPCEIISVDSALVYREMDIGTAKPDKAILQSVPHHLIDILDPTESYSAADFQRDALKLINGIHARGCVPLLVGGTMLYYRSLFNGLSNLPKADAEVRLQLEEEAKEQGWAEMHKQLAQIDPVSAQRINPNDPQRIQRALEVFRITGKSMTELQQVSRGEPFPFPCLKVVVAPSDRTILHQRIEARFIHMLEHGFIEEVERLRARGDLSLELPSMRAVGYRQVWEYLEGAYAYDDMVAKGVAATRQLAKRQYTWLRKEPSAQWFESDKPALFERVMGYFRCQ